MAKTTPFDAHPDRYDEWFERHDAAYQSELRALRSVLPEDGTGLEIGVGTGRFAGPLGVEHGVDPSPAMRTWARKRNVEVKDGVGEDLPYPNECFDYVLITTTMCYFDDPDRALGEARRVLRPKGTIVLGIIDRDSPLGRRYDQKGDDSTFYRTAHFHGASEVVRMLEEAGFEDVQLRQSLFSDPETMTEPDQVRDGHGDGGFVVVRGVKPDRDR